MLRSRESKLDEKCKAYARKDMTPLSLPSRKDAACFKLGKRGTIPLWLVYTTSSMSNRAIPSPVQPYYLLCRRVTGLKCFFVLHPAGVEQTACIIKSSSNRLHDIYIYICICIELDFKSVHTLESEPSAEESVGEVFRVTVL